MRFITDFVGRDLGFDCLECDFATHEKISPGGLIYEDNSIIVHPHPVAHMVGFIVVSPKRHVYFENDLKDQELDAITSAVPKHVFIARPSKKSENIVVLKVNIDMKNEIPNYIGKMCDAIKQVGEYNERNVDNVCDTIFDYVDEVVTSADEETAQKNAIGSWREILEKLNDPETRKRLLLYQTTNDYANIYGHVLSPGNVQSVLDQMPTASFVAEKHTWNNTFNRQLKPNAKPIIVTKPYDNFTASKIKKDEAARRAGFADYTDARRQTKNSSQVLHKIDMMAKDNRMPMFYKVKMYDVTDTIPPSDPTKDVWTNEIGLSNNISGILNAEAQKFDDAKTGAAKAQKDADMAKISQVQSARWKNRRLAIEKLCYWKKVNVSSLKTLSDQDFIPRASYAYAKSVMPSYGIIRPDNIERVAAMVGVMVCYMCDCNVPSEFTNYIKNLGRIANNDVASAYTVMRDLIPRLSKASRLSNDDLKNLQSQKFNVSNNNGATNESIAKVNKMLNERTSNTMSPQEFFNFCEEEFGNMDLDMDDQVDEVSNDVEQEELDEMKNYISKLVKEEINKYRR